MLNDYYMIPTKVMKGTFEIDGEVRRLTSNEKILYAELVRYGLENATHEDNKEDRRLFCEVGQVTLGEDVGLSAFSVRQNLKKLKASGLIEISKSTEYGADTYYIQPLPKD